VKRYDIYYNIYAIPFAYLFNCNIYIYFTSSIQSLLKYIQLYHCISWIDNIGFHEPLLLSTYYENCRTFYRLLLLLLLSKYVRRNSQIYLSTSFVNLRALWILTSCLIGSWHNGPNNSHGTRNKASPCRWAAIGKSITGDADRYYPPACIRYRHGSCQKHWSRYQHVNKRRERRDYNERRTGDDQSGIERSGGRGNENVWARNSSPRPLDFYKLTLIRLVLTRVDKLDL